MTTTDTPTTTLEELGLSSLERVELMMALEEALAGDAIRRAHEGDRTTTDIGQEPLAQQRHHFPGALPCLPSQSVQGPGVKHPPSQPDLS